MTTELKQAFHQKLTEAGIGYETLKVFGAIRLNVHVTCVSRDTAEKWSALLSTVLKGSKPKVCPTVWEAKKNIGGNLTPTMRKGFLIAAAA